MRGKPSTPWPAAHEKYLRRLIAQRLGDTAIAHALNACYGTAYTRNAIIGKRCRLKIPAPEGRERAPRQNGKRVLAGGYQPPPPARPRIRAAPAKQAETPKPRPGAAAKIVGPALRKLPFRPPQPVRPMLTGPHVAGIPLMLRQRHQCGWPINDGNPFLFCGMPKDEDGRSYCGWHEWLAMRPSRRQPLSGAA